MYQQRKNTSSGYPNKKELLKILAPYIEMRGLSSSSPIAYLRNPDDLDEMTNKVLEAFPNAYCCSSKDSTGRRVFAIYRNYKHVEDKCIFSVICYKEI